jgi:hypothetical protein
MSESDFVCKCALCSRERGEPNEDNCWQAARNIGPPLPDTVCLAQLIKMTFDQYDNERPEIVRDRLVRRLRQWSEYPDDISALIAEMLDPASKTEWRLDLRRPRPGNPGRLPTEELHILCFKYQSRVDDLKKRGRAAPAKTALGELATQYEMTDGELRAIIERAQGKRRRKR